MLEPTDPAPEPAPFKVGDVVRCVDDDETYSRLITGDTYAVVAVNDDGKYMKVSGSDIWWSVARFEHVTKADYAPTAAPDPVTHPAHYTNHPSGIETIQITEHMNFCRGNAIKYIWRAGEKGNEIEDLRKAVWYLQREIKRLEGAGK